MASKPFVMHVLSHTHWDREWYQDFQGYRQRLVFQMDKLLDLLGKRPQFRYFHLDGQTCVLADYVQIRPEARSRLARHTKSGRILIGPWFVMPDERLLSGESLVRNFLLGHRICRQWQAMAMPIGYVTDVFGHCSQLPQILKGFGIDSAMLHRGTSCAREKSEMVWEGADGSRVLLVAVYQDTGYNDFMTFREWTDKELLEYEKKKTALATTKVLYALDGNDHQPAKWDIPEEIARVNKVFRHIRCVHSSMPKYLAALRKALGGNWTKGRRRFAGELNIPAKGGTWSEVMNGFGSSRVYLKQANDELEHLLARVAEPLGAWAVLAGGRSQKSYLDLAWHYLLLNHPHDSICGCSIDQVHRDMVYRFDQARLIAANSVSESVQAVADKIDSQSLGDADAVVTVFNPANVATGPATSFSFDVKSDLVAEKESQGLVPALGDAAGNLIYCDVLRVERKVRTQPFAFITDRMVGVIPDVLHEAAIKTPLYRPRTYPVDRFHVLCEGAVPSLGYNTWRIVFRPRAALPNRPRKMAAVKCDPFSNRIENEFLRIAARKDGLIDIFDKVTGARYPGLFAFEDCGDAGEGWNYRAPKVDRVLLSTSRKAVGRASVKCDQTCVLSKSLRVAFRMRVPADLVDAKTGALYTGGRGDTARSKRLVTLSIQTIFTLHAGERRIDCRTAVRNTAQCHRLRVLFPTRRKTNCWYSDSAFDVVKRPIRLIDTTGWKEQMCPWQIIKNFAAVADKRGGLAVITKGLNEAAVNDDCDRTLALTLFRAFRENLLHEITQESQLRGELTLEYAIVPFTPDRGGVPASIFEQVDRYKLPLYSYTREPQAGPLPLSDSLVRVSSPAVVSTVKTAEDGDAVIVRVFNPTKHRSAIAIKPHFACTRAAIANFEEKPHQKGAISRTERLSIPTRPKEIVTVRMERPRLSH